MDYPIGGYHIGLRNIRFVPVPGSSTPTVAAEWVNDAPMGYSNWKDGRPYVQGKPGYDGPCGGAYVEGQQYGLSRWVSSDCDRVKRAAVCEHKLLKEEDDGKEEGGGKGSAGDSGKQQESDGGKGQGSGGPKVDVDVKGN